MFQKNCLFYKFFKKRQQRGRLELGDAMHAMQRVLAVVYAGGGGGAPFGESICINSCRLRARATVTAIRESKDF
jgi:hypothetical protein